MYDSSSSSAVAVQEHPITQARVRAISRRRFFTVGIKVIPRNKVSAKIDRRCGPEARGHLEPRGPPGDQVKLSVLAPTCSSGKILLIDAHQERSSSTTPSQGR